MRWAARASLVAVADVWAEPPRRSVGSLLLVSVGFGEAAWARPGPAGCDSGGPGVGHGGVRGLACDFA